MVDSTSRTTNLPMDHFDHIGTDCVHAGFDYDKETGAVMPPISLSTTFKQSSPGVPIGVSDIHSVRSCIMIRPLSTAEVATPPGPFSRLLLQS